MKNTLFALTFVGSTLFIATGCQSEQAPVVTPSQTSTNAAVSQNVNMNSNAILMNVNLNLNGTKTTSTNTNTATQVKNTNVNAVTLSTPMTKETMEYRGSWFAVKYPKGFTASPVSPSEMYEGKEHVTTDEARFLSSDKSVEFFIYSPQWGGNPENYLDLASSETLVSEKSENGGAGMEKQVTKWATIKAKDGSYTRSYVSMKDQVDTGSDTHHVFGIKYKDQASYDKYKEAYIAFKASLEQFAD